MWRRRRSDVTICVTAPPHYIQTLGLHHKQRLTRFVNNTRNTTFEIKEEGRCLIPKSSKNLYCYWCEFLNRNKWAIMHHLTVFSVLCYSAWTICTARFIWLPARVSRHVKSHTRQRRSWRSIETNWTLSSSMRNDLGSSNAETYADPSAH